MKQAFAILRNITLCVIALLSFSVAAHASSLQYELTGVEGELRKNVLAWLGAPPESAHERSNFMFTAREHIERSLKALGYYQPEISLDVERTEPVWQLLIDIEPGEPVRIGAVDIQLMGEALEDPAFQSLLQTEPIKRGDAINHGTYDRFKRQMQSLGQRRGFFDASFTKSRVEVEPIAGVADIHLHYQSGTRYRFGPVSYDYALLEEDLLDPLLGFSEGDYYDQARVQDAQAMLQRTGYFSTAMLRPDVEGAPPGEVPLALELFPANRHNFDLGIGYSTDTEGRLSATWRTPRINRFGHSQETRLQYSEINPSGQFTYTIPMSHPLNDIVQIGLRAEDNEFGDLNSTQKEIGLRRERKHEKWVYSYFVRGLNEAWDIIGVRAENDYILPGITLSRRDRSGSPVNPSSGFSQLYRLEAAGKDLGSDVDMLRLNANFGHITSLNERQRLVSRAELGWVLMPDEDRVKLAPSLNFFAGGAQSIRGFSYQSIGNEVSVQRDNDEKITLVVGGDRLITTSLEYQYSFNSQWRGAVFADAGDAFDSGEFELNYAAGFGVHYVTPVGAIRLEIANPISEDNPEWRLHLAIGAEF